MIVTPKQLKNFWDKVDKSGGSTACWLWIAAKDKDGYGRFMLWDGVKKINYRANKLSFLLAGMRLPKGHLVLHKCPLGANTSCVNPLHLKAGTSKDNALDRDLAGNHPSVLHPELRPKGEAMPLAKLTDQAVIEIRRAYKLGMLTGIELAKKYGISSPNLYNILNRKAWKHI